MNGLLRGKTAGDATGPESLRRKLGATSERGQAGGREDQSETQGLKLSMSLILAVALHAMLDAGMFWATGCD